MSLTLARLCGEWRLVSRNYKAWGASGGKYKAQIEIFHILATVNRFSRISRKVESRWGKLESHWRKLESCWRKQKAIEESRKPLTKVGKPLKKIGLRVKKIGLRARKIWFLARKISIFPRDSLASGNFGVLFWHQICYHVRAWIYLICFNYS